MKIRLGVSFFLLALVATAEDGNQQAQHIGEASPLVKAAMKMLTRNVRSIHDQKIREATLDAIHNPVTCIAHRANLNNESKDSILKKLEEEGLLTAGPSVKEGVFPPVKNDGSPCPHLALVFFGAPGSAEKSHHSYPGGLAVHEAFNQQSALNFLATYRKLFGRDTGIDDSWVIAAPAWHDWAKTIVFQWKQDGEILEELNFGGNGKTDNNGLPGDSRTGAHHILGLAESMARGLPPGLVLTQASAHAAPTLGNEYKVVNWLHAAAVIARIDPAAKGYLVVDKAGHWRLPTLKHLWDGLDLNESGRANFLIEYQIHNLSDADFVESIPAVDQADFILASIAKQFGYDPADKATYNWKFRHPVLAFIGAERISMLYSSEGLNRVTKEVEVLKAKHLI